VAQAIGLGLMIVVTYAVITWAGLNSFWFEMTLVATAVVGIGALVARGSGDRPFWKAATVASMALLCILLLDSVELTSGPPEKQPWVLPPPWTMGVITVAGSLMIGAMSGAVALGLRSLWDRTTGHR